MRTLLPLLLITSTLQAQPKPNDTLVLLTAIHDITSKQPIVYVDSVNTKGDFPEHLKKRILEGTITSQRKTKPEPSITLSKKEQNFILSELAKPVVWPKELFANGKLMNAKTMWAHLDEERAKRFTLMNQATLNKDTLEAKRLSREYSYVFVFTKPIYIRNNTVCLVTMAALCGNPCGFTETSFYKREKDSWVKWIGVAQGDF